MRLARSEHGFELVFFLAFLIRVILIPFFTDDFNFWAARVFSGFWMDGFNPWSVVFHDPTLYWINPWRYPPPYVALVSFAQFFGNLVQNEIVFLYLAKLPLIFAEMMIIFFIYKIVLFLRRSQRDAVVSAFFYAFNPVTIYLGGVWAGGGVMEPIPLMFTVIALYFFLVSDSRTKLALSAIMLGWGIAFKLYPVFIMPAFLVRIRNLRKALIYSTLVVLPISLFSLPYLLWDSHSYIGILAVLNTGGLHPLFPVLYPGTSLIVQIAFFSLAALLFAIAYSGKTSITHSIVLSFLALFIAFGGNLATYSLWIVPFATLLLTDEKLMKIRSLWFLPFLPIISIIYALIYNGPYNSVEGVTGIFYLTYHWNRSKTVVFRNPPFTELQAFLGFTNVLLMLNTASILYLFFRISRLSSSFSARADVKKQASGSEKGKHRANRLLPFAVVSTTLLCVLIFPSVVSFESPKQMPLALPDTLVFFDDFSNSLLNYQWSFIGEGDYTINCESDPSYIHIRAIGEPHNRSAIYRGWGPIWHGFFRSNSTTISFRFRFDSISDGSDGLVIAKSNGGYFGAKRQGSTIRFVYEDVVSNSTFEIAGTDTTWHVVEIVYNSAGRFIIFENSFAAYLKGQTSFSFLFLGSPDIAEDYSGSFSIDWVKVMIQDFPTNAPNRMLSVLAVSVPMLASAILSVGLLFPRRIHSYWHRLSGLMRSERDEEHSP